MDLYREALIEHYKNSTHRGKLANATKTIKEANPLCGDMLELDLLIEDGVIKDAKFDGQGCAISIASTSMLIDKIIGKPVAEVKKLSKEDLLKEVNPNLTLSRIKCATLGFNALTKALNTV